MATQNNGKTSIAPALEQLSAIEIDTRLGMRDDGRATMIVGFSWGGWVTGGTSRTLASTAGDVARGELAALICVERFNAAPDSRARLVEFNAPSDGYGKRQFVEAGGWATMPGDKSASCRAAEG